MLVIKNLGRGNNFQLWNSTWYKAMSESAWKQNLGPTLIFFVPFCSRTSSAFSQWSSPSAGWPLYQCIIVFLWAAAAALKLKNLALEVVVLKTLMCRQSCYILEIFFQSLSMEAWMICKCMFLCVSMFCVYVCAHAYMCASCLIVVNKRGKEMVAEIAPSTDIWFTLELGVFLASASNQHFFSWGQW